ncbi:MAG TPA: ABC transporter permease [Bacillaceae bacterium]|nr:ABC transporter permease [Paenibacillus bovis]HLU22187.1 ABC transporter permease [Bacillaceae bacterium]
MIGLIQNELMKIFSKKSSWIYMIILFVLALGGAIIYFFIINKFPEFGFGTADSTSTWHFMNNIVYGLGSLVTLFSVIVASAIVAAEFSSGTIKQLMIRPHARWKILLSKYITVILYALMLLIGLCVVGFIIGILFFGLGDYNATTTEFTFTGDTFEAAIGAQAMKKLLLLIPSLIITVTISFMLSTLFRSQALAVGVGVGVLFVSSTIGQIIIIILNFGKLTWLKYLIFPHLDLSIYAITDTLAKGVTVGFSAVLLLVYYAIFMTLTFLFFQKRDIAF